MIISLQTDFFNAEAGGTFHICFLHQEDTCVFKHPFIAKKSILWAGAHMWVFQQRSWFFLFLGWISGDGSGCVANGVGLPCVWVDFLQTGWNSCPPLEYLNLPKPVVSVLRQSAGFF